MRAGCYVLCVLVPFFFFLCGRHKRTSVSHRAWIVSHPGARDLLLISHLQETIINYDPPIMIQFNRTMIVLGLCAFRAGLIAEAHSCLTEICSLNKTRELLGQVRCFASVSPICCLFFYLVIYIYIFFQ